MRLGVIARAGQSGLGTQTLEVVRHMEPERVLVVVDPNATRPDDHLDWYTNTDHETAILERHRLPDSTVARFVDSVDVIWTAETFYDPTLIERARISQTRTVCHLNPELWHPHDRAAAADVLLSATTWRLRPGVTHLPHPVADGFPAREPSPLFTFLHVPAPAMLDRNGTEIVLAALEHVTVPCRVVLHGARGDDPWQVGSVRVEWSRTCPADYRDTYRAEYDALLLPRRYAGLSLTMQEAAAAGMLVVTTDMAPQNGWFPPELLCAPGQMVDRPMKAGPIPVAHPDPRDVARMMDRVVAASDETRAGWAHECRRWADSISWDAMLPEWERTLRR